MKRFTIALVTLIGTAVLLTAWTLRFIHASNSRESFRRKLAPFITQTPHSAGQRSQAIAYFDEDLERCFPYLSSTEQTNAVRLRKRLHFLQLYSLKPPCVPRTPQEVALLDAADLSTYGDAINTSPELERWHALADEVAAAQSRIDEAKGGGRALTHSEVADFDSLRIEANHARIPPPASTNFISCRTCVFLLERDCSETAISLRSSLNHPRWLP